MAYFSPFPEAVVIAVCNELNGNYLTISTALIHNFLMSRKSDPSLHCMPPELSMPHWLTCSGEREFWFNRELINSFVNEVIK